MTIEFKAMENEELDLKLKPIIPADDKEEKPPQIQFDKLPKNAQTGVIIFAGFIALLFLYAIAKLLMAGALI